LKLEIGKCGTFNAGKLPPLPPIDQAGIYLGFQKCMVLASKKGGKHPKVKVIVWGFFGTKLLEGDEG
jgi:hypothetical protein